ncbi:MAG TPA: A/G-specific adenine glycosylase [bacterium]|nr:A/G-specific adenine glycosylase [bacterium]
MTDLPRFQEALLRWYRLHGRDLPWRRTTDPYRIFISEVMLQQTQVERVVGYWHAFLQAFPTVQALAAADEAQVLAAWKGLGYNNRARYVHKTAKAVVELHGGQFPRTLEELRSLPGIGRYTAGAIMSFAFCEDAPIVDTNVVRVLGRVFGPPKGDYPAARESALWDLAEAVLPPGQGFIFNQAIMDFGATMCSHHHPACDICPMAGFCARRAAELAAQPRLFPPDLAQSPQPAA